MRKKSRLRVAGFLRRTRRVPRSFAIRADASHVIPQYVFFAISLLLFAIQKTDGLVSRMDDVLILLLFFFCYATKSILTARFRTDSKYQSDEKTAERLLFLPFLLLLRCSPDFVLFSLFIELRV